MPVIFGTSLAVVIGGARLSWGRFVLALAGMMVLHSAANMMSDVHDFRRGLDRDVTPVSGAIVRGWLTWRRVAAVSVILFIAGSAVGLLLIRLTSPVLLWVGAVGVAVGAFYTVLKAHALGDLAVFLDFGLLGALGAWVVQTKSFSWLPVVWTVPMAMLVSAILHANNWRDAVSDTERRVRTVGGLLGDRGSLAYYGCLIFGPFVIVLGFIFVPRLIARGLPPAPTFLIVLLASAERLSPGAGPSAANPPRPLDFVILDGATARHNLVFGALSVAAVWLEALLHAL
jgi:1,4-dihydroxy-2-naphthoate octaprenyltransferase